MEEEVDRSRRSKFPKFPKALFSLSAPASRNDSRGERGNGGAPVPAHGHSNQLFFVFVYVRSIRFWTFESAVFFCFLRSVYTFLAIRISCFFVFFYVRSIRLGCRPLPPSLFLYFLFPLFSFCFLFPLFAFSVFFFLFSLSVFFFLFSLSLSLYLPLFLSLSLSFTLFPFSFNFSLSLSLSHYRFLSPSLLLRLCHYPYSPSLLLPHFLLLYPSPFLTPLPSRFPATYAFPKADATPGQIRSADPRGRRGRDECL